MTTDYAPGWPTKTIRLPLSASIVRERAKPAVTDPNQAADSVIEATGTHQMRTTIRPSCIADEDERGGCGLPTPSLDDDQKGLQTLQTTGGSQEVRAVTESADMSPLAALAILVQVPVIRLVTLRRLGLLTCQNRDGVTVATENAARLALRMDADE